MFYTVPGTLLISVSVRKTLTTQLTEKIPAIANYNPDIFTLSDHLFTDINRKLTQICLNIMATCENTENKLMALLS